MLISGCSAIVTGGASGLGAATSRALVDKGAQVVAIDLPKALDKAEAIQGIHYVAADVTNPDQVTAAVQVATDLAPLRIAVNCAGIGTAGRILGRQGPHDLAVFRQVIEVNLVGTFNVLRLAAEAMANNVELANGQRGIVVNTASIAAFEGQIGQVAYSASKGAIVGLTLPAARDLASVGIRMMAIAPGIVDTPMLAGVTDEFRAGLAAGIPFPKRLALPTEYAQLAIAIIEHDYLNGEVIRMDGALRMTPR